MEVKVQVGSAPLVLYGSRPAAFFYYLPGPSEHLGRVRPTGGDETTVDRLRELARRSERIYVVAEKGDHELLRRDYPSVTAVWKEVDRGYLDWSREMVLLSNKP